MGADAQTDGAGVYAKTGRNVLREERYALRNDVTREIQGCSFEGYIVYQKMFLAKCRRDFAAYIEV